MHGVTIPCARSVSPTSWIQLEVERVKGGGFKWIVPERRKDQHRSGLSRSLD